MVLKGVTALADGMRKEWIDGEEVWVIPYDEEALRFRSISEFKWSLETGGEIVIVWKDVFYGIFRDPRDERFCIGRQGEPATYYDTVDELLEHSVEGDRLRGIVTKMAVSERFL